MEVVVDISDDIVRQFSKPPAGGAGGKLLKVGHIEEVDTMNSFSATCREYIIIQLDRRVLGVVPNTPQGMHIVQHNVNNYRHLGKSCILHILSLDRKAPYKQIKVL